MAVSPPGKPKGPARLGSRHQQQVKFVRSALGSKSLPLPAEALDLGFTTGATPHSEANHRSAA
ncbi:hypothetical protein [Streptomyces sp. NPDC047108]|uniref:hypothetical protein n=1 Tax=Streptomyces sp. NPDC047108 TaxID=3155025 RepID=UPI0033DF102B